MAGFDHSPVCQPEAAMFISLTRFTGHLFLIFVTLRDLRFIMLLI